MILIARRINLAKRVLKRLLPWNFYVMVKFNGVFGAIALLFHPSEPYYIGHKEGYPSWSDNCHKTF